MMPVVDYGKMPEFPMRAGITGKWIAGQEQGATSVSVLANTAQPGVAVPKHFHGYEEVVLVEAGEVWVELDKIRVTAGPGQSVTIPPHTPHAWGVVGSSPARVLFIWPVLEPFAPGKSTYLDGAPPAVS
jgi:quercetin dioxygenase-like cupin family protein